MGLLKLLATFEIGALCGVAVMCFLIGAGCKDEDEQE